MNKVIKNIVFFALMLNVPLAMSQNNLCSSSYLFKQKLDLNVMFGSSSKETTKREIVFHVRELPVSVKKNKNYTNNKGNLKNIRQYALLAIPKINSSNGIDVDISKRYEYPFMAIVDADSGAVIDLKSVANERNVIDEYKSYMDYFQYTDKKGIYRYQNGNGFYNANIEIESATGKISKDNRGYIALDGNNIIKINKSTQIITPSEEDSACFFSHSQVSEDYKMVMSDKAFVQTSSNVEIVLQKNMMLSDSHYFYSLTDNLNMWPKPQPAKKLSKKEALEKIPEYISQLSLQLTDDKMFLETMRKNTDIWPYLTDYLLVHGMTKELSVQLFWSLDRIDTTESVDLLTELATSPLTDADNFRAALALGSTSAPFSTVSIDKLITDVEVSHISGEVNASHFVNIRMLGAMAKNRILTSPEQHSEIKLFLYSQVGLYDEKTNAVVIDAIGNLKSSIDEQGEDILFSALNNGSEKTQQAAAAAFTRIPYKSEYMDTFIDIVNVENTTSVKSDIVLAMGNADDSDYKVKDELLLLLKNNNVDAIRKSSLKSMEKIGFKLSSTDVNQLEMQLKNESDKYSQKLLAKLILNSRR